MQYYHAVLSCSNVPACLAFTSVGFTSGAVMTDTLLALHCFAVGVGAGLVCFQRSFKFGSTPACAPHCYSQFSHACFSLVLFIFHGKYSRAQFMQTHILQIFRFRFQVCHKRGHWISVSLGKATQGLTTFTTGTTVYILSYDPEAVTLNLTSTAGASCMHL